MPELPEVEVSRLGITPHIQGERVEKIIVRNPKLRWPVPENIREIEGRVIRAVERRAKYLMLVTDAGYAVVHLGMSGSLRVLPAIQPAGKHDHVDLVMASGTVLRYNDPRRFGAWLWQEGHGIHPVLSKLGPEPLSEVFNPDYLLAKAKGKRTATKSFIMDNAVVVGVGNIYANESLFTSGIHPAKPVGKLSAEQVVLLVSEIKKVLASAILQGGTTLKDFTNADGKPGYFAQELLVYGKAGKPCPVCSTELEQMKIGQRNTTFCPECQKA